jgi:hypothetical protein
MKSALERERDAAVAKMDKLLAELGYAPAGEWRA